MKLFFAALLLAVNAVRAADPTPLDLKVGEWEYTVTMQMSGMPQASAAQMPRIPADQLAKLPPEQRAKIEAALKQAGDMSSGKPTTNKSCVKKEDLVRMNPLASVDKGCKMTVINSSNSKMEAKVECDSTGNKSSSTVTLEATSSESSKFRVVTAGETGGRPVHMTINGTGKWLGPTCTEKK